MSAAPQLNAQLLSSLSVRDATTADIVDAGAQLVRDDRVRLLGRSPVAAHFSVRDETGRARSVTLQAKAGRWGAALAVDCDCPEYDGSDLCRHMVAAFFTLEAALRGTAVVAPPPQRPLWERTLDGVMRDLAAETAAQAGKPRTTAAGARSLLFFSVQERTTGSWGVYLYSLAASRFPAEAVALSEDGGPPSPDAVAKAIDANKLSGAATGVRTVDASRFPHATAAERQAAFALVTLNQYYSYSYHYAPAGVVEQALTLLAGSGAVYHGKETDPLKKKLEVLPPGMVRAALAVRQTDDGGLVMLPSLMRLDGDIEREMPFNPKQDKLIFRTPLHVLTAKGVLAAVSDATAPFRSLVEEQTRQPKLGDDKSPKGIVIPAEGRDQFFEKYVVPLAAHLPVTGDGITWEEVPEVPPIPRLYLTEKSGALRADLRFAYGDQETTYDPMLPSASVARGSAGGSALRRVKRNPGEEQDKYALLGSSAYGLKRDDPPGSFVLRARVEPVDFLLHHVPRLAAAGFEIFGEDNVKSVKVNRSKPSFNFGVSSGIDWFDVEAVLTFGEVPAALADVKKAIRNRERYVKLADGSIGEIPPDWLEKFRFLFTLGEDTKDGLRLTSAQALLLDQAIKDSDGDSTVDAEFAARRDRLRAFDGITERPLPPTGLDAALYPYQKAGYDWLHFLHDYGFGGCLADEMGLGKTVVTLSFLLSLRRAMTDGGEPHTNAPDLVVVPRSLLFNWEREAARFTPDLRVRVHADGSRLKDAASLTAGTDIVVTTYGIMLRDIETLRAAKFHYAVLDEAQAIKNPLAQTARAARLLKTEHRLTLTGTPVENGTLELWSQFAFLDPGLLGSLERFKTEFAGAIERRQDENATAALRRLTAPFLLRRTKDQVAKDLPPRTEQIVFTEMESAQRKLYDKLRDQFRAQVMGLLEDGTEGANAGKTQIKILEGLLRLRQVCCHPRLVDKEFTGESAKIDVLLETLETLRAEGHKALVFSQFTQMLAIVREEMEKREIPYLYLDGKTRDRQGAVDRFQADADVPFFLISLKAGGVGLNLTAADYVLHLDPWWNPAVERQATDRTHRIGQTKPVFVYKYVMRDSVEEKILVLQDRKRALVDQLITTEGGLFKSLTRADIEGLFS